MSRFRLTAPRVKLSENHVRRACLDVLRAHGWWPIRQHVGRFNPAGRSAETLTIGVPGDPDYAVIKAPSFFLETKRPGGKLSDTQRARIDVLRQCYGLETAVVESVEELVAWLDEYEKRDGSFTVP